MRLGRLGLLCALITNGCTVNTDPSGALIACHSGSECPGDLICNAEEGESGTCVLPGSDITPPGIADGSVALTIWRPPDCFMSAVDEVQPGGVVNLRFVSTRSLESAPNVVAGSGDFSFELGSIGSSGQEYRFIGDVPHDAPAGEYAIEAFLQTKHDQDWVAVEPVRPLRVTRDPAPLAPEVLEEFTYTRAPWGSQDAGQDPLFRVAASLDSLPPGINVAVYDATTVAGALLAVGVVANDGSFSIELPIAGVARLNLAFADAACNRIPVIDSPEEVHPVKHTRWVVTGAAMAADEWVTSPHAYVSTTSLTAQLPKPRVASASELAAIAAIDGDAWTQSGGGGWTRIFAGDEPAGTARHGVAYDNARGVAVMFGGSTGIPASAVWGFTAATHEWDGVTWTYRRSELSPEARGGHAMAYDRARGVTVLFGGERNADEGSTSCDDGLPLSGFGRCVLDDTWEWDGIVWRQRYPATSPLTRRYHAMSFDRRRARVLLHGGVSYVGVGATCRDTGLLSDQNGDCYHNDTWEWDGDDWRMLLPTNVAAEPSQRSNAGMVYDPIHHRTLLFGGQYFADAGGADCADGSVAGDDSRCALSDLWAWDGNSWTVLDSMRMPASFTRPPGRSWPGLAFDETSGEIDLLLFGGIEYAGACGSGPANACRDLWRWDGAEWHNSPQDGEPSARSGEGAFFDPVRGELVVHGGLSLGWASQICPNDAYPFHGECYDLETWRLNEHGWSRAVPHDLPLALTDRAMIYDTDREVAMAFGGLFDLGEPGGICPSGTISPGNGRCETNDTYTWDGTDWHLIASAQTPPARFGAAMAWDPNHGAALLHGGRTCSRESDGSCPSGSVSTFYDACCLFEDTWLWDGSEWEPQSPTATPGSSFAAGLAFDGANDRLLLFGGGMPMGLSDETWAWEWTGTDPDWEGDWELLTPATKPAARVAPMMVSAPDGRVLLVSGSDGVTLISDTWEWQDDNWHPRYPATPPPALYAAAACYDPVGQRVLMTGGLHNNGVNGDTWLWNGLQWTELTADPALEPRAGAAMVYDPLRGAQIFGGANADRTLLEYAAWDDGVASAPGQGFAITLDATEAAADDTVVAVAITWSAGGWGFEESVPVDGAKLVVWDEGFWKEEARNNAAPAAPAILTWSTDTDLEWYSLPDEARERRLRRLLFGPRRLLNAAVVPIGQNGAGAAGGTYASVASDGFEVTIDYRSP